MYVNTQLTTWMSVSVSSCFIILISLPFNNVNFSVCLSWVYYKIKNTFLVLCCIAFWCFADLSVHLSLSVVALFFTLTFIYCLSLRRFSVVPILRWPSLFFWLSHSFFSIVLRKVCNVYWTKHILYKINNVSA